MYFHVFVCIFPFFSHSQWQGALKSPNLLKVIEVCLELRLVVLYCKGIESYTKILE
jgi:hypothetical protein